MSAVVRTKSPSTDADKPINLDGFRPPILVRALNPVRFGVYTTLSLKYLLHIVPIDPTVQKRKNRPRKRNGSVRSSGNEGTRLRRFTSGSQRSVIATDTPMNGINKENAVQIVEDDDAQTISQPRNRHARRIDHEYIDLGTVGNQDGKNNTTRRRPPRIRKRFFF